MSFLKFLFAKPSIKRFASDLIAAAARRGVPGWRYVPEKQELHAPDDEGRMSLTNMFLEYSRAPRARRPALIEKYVAVMVSLANEIPKLWSMAQKAIYPVLRSGRDMVAVQIRSRTEAKPFPPLVEIPWQGDVVIRIAYDSGPATLPIGFDLLDTWGVSVEQALERAIFNLRALPKPQWVPIAPGLMRLESDVSYEESLLLREDVVESCDVRGDRIFMPINRGVLLATGSAEAGGIDRLLENARLTFENDPWPLSPVIVKHTPTGFAPFEPEGPAAEQLRSLQALDTFIAYRDQQEALQKHCESAGVDIYVASVDLMQMKADPNRLRTWAAWTEGVPTWLPKVDLIAFNKAIAGDNYETAIVPWDAAYELCQSYLKPLEEHPVRFSVESFPNDDDWRKLCAAGEAIPRS